MYHNLNRPTFPTLLVCLSVWSPSLLLVFFGKNNHLSYHATAFVIYRNTTLILVLLSCLLFFLFFYHYVVCFVPFCAFFFFSAIDPLKNGPLLLLLSPIGLLLQKDVGVISGAIKYIVLDFGLSTLQKVKTVTGHTLFRMMVFYG